MKIQKQNNTVSTAKYEYSAVQKNVMFRLIEYLQPLMTENEMEWQEHNLTIPLKDLDKNRNYDRIKDDLKALRDKSLEFRIKKNGAKRETEIVTGLISSFEHEFGSEEIKIQIPSRVLPFLCYIGGGYTSLQTVIAISLKSIHSKRAYEICCRWKNKDGFSYPLEDFKEMMGISGKYKQIIQLKERVLNVAKRELEEKADVWFDYSLEKKHSRAFNWIHVKIFTQSPKATKKGKKGDMYSFLWRFLQHAYPSIKSDKAMVICEELTNTDRLKEAYQRFIRLDDELTQGKKKKTDIIPMIKHILKEDFNIK